MAIFMFPFLYTDAGLMFVIMLCSLILAQEDGSLTKWTRIPILGVGGAALWHGLWLLGIWEPSPVGYYPPSRVTFDGALTIAAISRTIVVLRELKKNSGRLFAPYTFGRQ